MNARRAVYWAGAAILVAGIVFALTRPAGAIRRDIGNQELRELASGGARLIDVRSPGEYAMGHVPGAENVPVENIASAAKSWDRKQPLVVYCATGARSSEAVGALASMGFRELYNHSQGVSAWDGELTTEQAAGAEAIRTAGKPVLVEFSSGG